MATILNPPPTGGTGNAFGGVPGQLGLPDPFGDLSKVLPGLPKANAQASSNVLSELSGNLSPETLNNLQNASATYAARSGMPGTNAIPGDLFNMQNLLSNVQTTQQRQAQGLKDYNALIPTVSGTQTVTPALQTEISNVNALRNAAPNPQAQFNLAKSLYDEYAAKVRGPAGTQQSSSGPQGGTGTDQYARRLSDYNKYWAGATPGAGGASTVTGNTVGTGGVPAADWTTSDPFGTSGFPGGGGDVFGGAPYNPANDPLYGGGGTYAPTDVPMAGAAGQGDYSSLGIDDALAQVFGI